MYKGLITPEMVHIYLFFLIDKKNVDLCIVGYFNESMLYMFFYYSFNNTETPRYCLMRLTLIDRLTILILQDCITNLHLNRLFDLSLI